MQKGFILILVLIGIIIVTLIAGGVFYFIKSQYPSSLEDAVYRQNPMILLPTSLPESNSKPSPDMSTLNNNKDETANWKTYTNNLLQISYSGGMCPSGVCSSTKSILKDGSFLVNGELKTKISEQEINELQSLIASTDFASVKAVKFIGTCPTAYDGQELTYIFYTPKGLETIASCQVKIDINSPLFAKIDQLASKEF